MLKKIKSDIHVTELLKGSFIALFFKVLGVLMQYFFFWVLAKYFNAKGVGVFSLLWTILMIISVFSKLGFDTAIVKLIATYSSTRKQRLIPRVYKRVVVLVIGIATCLTLLMAVFSKFTGALFFESTDYIHHILFICLAIVPFSLLQINAESFKALKKISLYSLFQNGSVFTISLIFILLVYPYFKNDKLIVLSVLISIVVLTIISLILIKKEFSISVKGLKEKISSIGFKIESSGSLLKLSLPMLLSNSLFLMLSWTDTLMLGALTNEADVGVYNVSLKIAALNIIILVGVNSIAMPKYAELFAGKQMKALKKFVKQTTFLVFMLSFPVFLFIMIFPGFLLGLFGSEFLTGVQSLVILTIGQAFSAFSSSTITLLNMTGKEISVRNILIFTVVVNIVMNYFLIPLYGINGAAISTASSTVLWNILAVVVMYKNFNFTSYPFYKGMFKKHG